MTFVDQFIFDIFPQVGIFSEKAFRLASFIFDPKPFIVLFLFTLIFVFFKYGRKQAISFLFSISLTIFTVYVLKHTVLKDRPLGQDFLGPSFPSAHSAIAACYFLYLLHFLKGDTNRLRKILHYFFSISCIIFVGVSRLYLEVHWFSDVLVGYVIGIFFCFIFIKHTDSFKT